MDESLRAQIDSNLSHLDSLIRRGRQIREILAIDPASKSALVANRAWQQDCGVAIHQLSGGSKAHWLARAFSEAFLLRTVSGQVIETAAPDEIVERLVGVLDQAILSLSRMDDGEHASTSPVAAPLPHRFDFVHNVELRPVLEQGVCRQPGRAGTRKLWRGVDNLQRNSGSNCDGCAGIQRDRRAGFRRSPCGKDRGLDVHRSSRRCREGGADSRWMRPIAGSCAEVSRD